jgi:hypothetical protein
MDLGIDGIMMDPLSYKNVPMLLLMEMVGNSGFCINMIIECGIYYLADVYK